MSPEGVREAIVGPTRSRGVVFESEELIQALVDSTAHGVGSLPLLQFALAELWDQRDAARSRITRAALDEMGGVAGALSRHADQVIARLAPAERQAARRLLVHLVTAEGTRIERREEELVGEADPAPRAALRALVEGRLVHARTEGDQASCGIAHDSLIESWGTLRDWLVDDLAYRAVRQRLEAASAEWERLARAREALWGQRQLDETRPLDPSTLGPREHAFLLASQRTLMRQRWRRRLAVLLAVLTLAAVYGGPRLQAYFAEARFVDGQLAAARDTLGECRNLGQRASAKREEALALFDGRAPPTASPDTSDLWGTAERQWAQALAALEQADDTCARASQTLERALEHSYRHGDVRRLLMEVTYERLLLAERFHQRRARDELTRRLERMLEGSKAGEVWRQRLSAQAELELVTNPPGARVEIERYITDSQGRRRREPVPGLPPGRTPLTLSSLPAGSYLLHITGARRAPVELPVLLERGGHEQLRVDLPASVPAGYVYIPPGCFLLGSADPEEVRSFLGNAPLHRFCINAGYLIGQTEVTFGDWLTYLDSLPPEAPARHILEQPRFSATGAAAITLRHEPDAGWVFSFYRSPTLFSRARAGEAIQYSGRLRRSTADWRRLPLSGVSAQDLEGYFYWLDRSGRLPGARLCGEHEWERAARGADDRTYPHGDRLRPDDANIDVTYDRQPTAFGPDVVGAHPDSASPFGVLDLAGNAVEMTRPLTPELGRIVLRGGGWYYEEVMARIANRSAGDPMLRDARIGVRACATFTPH